MLPPDDDPIRTLRVLLARSKARGEDFEVAWQKATRALRSPGGAQAEGLTRALSQLKAEMGRAHYGRPPSRAALIAVQLRESLTADPTSRDFNECVSARAPETCDG